MKRFLFVAAPLAVLSSAPAQAGKRQVVLRPATASARASLVPPVPRSPLLLRSSVRANAQLLPDAVARKVDLAGNSLQIGLGDVVLLPLAGVTRIITEDDEVARAYFQAGSPVLQGAGVGQTTVEIYQASGTPRVLTVNVSAQVSPPINLPIVSPTPFEPPVIAIPSPTFAPSGGISPNGNNGSETGFTPMPTPSSVGVGPAVLLPPITPSRSSLQVSLVVLPAPGHPGQAQFVVGFSNPGTAPAKEAVVRFPLDERVSYVTGSATNSGQYDPARREVVWELGNVAPGVKGQASLRVQPIDRGPLVFDSVANVEDASGVTVSSALVRFSTTPSPLLTVFALPDRFLSGINGPNFRDVNVGEPQGAIERLRQLGVTRGVGNGFYYPKQSTQRAEYAVMTLNGLNLRDLRDQTQLKFVLSRRATVSLSVQNSAGARVAELVRGAAFEAGEHTALWNGKTSAGGFAAPGRYTYVCQVKDGANQTATLRGTLNLVSTSPIEVEGTPSFLDVKPTDWFARYLAVGEKQGIVFGFPDKTFRPRQPITRVEATAIVVRALGLSDVAKTWADKDVGFLDYTQIPNWARGAVNVATTIAKTGAGTPILQGTKGNRFEPLNDLSRGQAALIVQRLIDRETTRRVGVSGEIQPGAVVSINSRPIAADGNGKFSFELDVTTSTPITLSVVNTQTSG